MQCQFVIIKDFNTKEVTYFYNKFNIAKFYDRTCIKLMCNLM